MTDYLLRIPHYTINPLRSKDIYIPIISNNIILSSELQIKKNTESQVGFRNAKNNNNGSPKQSADRTTPAIKKRICLPLAGTHFRLSSDAFIDSFVFSALCNYFPKGRRRKHKEPLNMCIRLT